jgi:putative transposase
MSRRGNCYDNAFIESFWSSLKYEVVYHQRFATFADARNAIRRVAAIDRPAAAGVLSSPAPTVPCDFRMRE